MDSFSIYQIYLSVENPARVQSDVLGSTLL